MRLLFAHPGLLAFGNSEGGIKGYRALVAALAATGHDCEVVSIPAAGPPVDPADWHRLCSIQQGEGPRRPIAVALSEPLPVAEVRSPRRPIAERLLGLLRIRRVFSALLERRIRAFRPDAVIWENGAGNLRLALEIAGDRLAVLVGSPLLLPFGPRGGAAWWASSPLSVYRRVPKIFAPSGYVRDYLGEHAGLRSFFQPNVAYGPPPFSNLGRFDGAITMINPVLPKGAAVFEGLVRAFPGLRFRAIETYLGVLPSLRGLPNLEIVPSTDDLDAALADTKLLVVPSMWGEAWGMVCVDAMLRGIPVLASDDGGLPESTFGVGDCIPIEPLRFERTWFGAVRRVVPAPVIAPWRAALEPLAGDRSVWEARAAASRAAALAHLASLRVEPLCDFLRT